jgi:hypothetical protein
MNSAITASTGACGRVFRLAALLAAAGLLFSAVPARAGGPGSAGVQILKSDISPRAAGMAGSFAAVADDVYAMNYNPAGLGQLYLPQASAMYYSGFDDSRLNYFAFAMPLPVQGVAGYDKPGVGISALFTNSGDFVYRPIQPDGTVPAISMNAETTKVLTLSYAEKVYAGETDLEGYKANIEQYLGFSAKYVNSKLLDTYSASALAMDAGWLVRDLNSGVSFGVSAANLGSGLKYYQQSTPLPSILRVGAAFQPPTVMSQSLLFTVDGDLYLQEKLKSLRAGIEYRFQDIFALRLGYKGLDDNKGMAFGMGINYQNFSLDFGMLVSGQVFNTSQMAFSYQFAGWHTAEVKKKKERVWLAPEPKARQGGTSSGSAPKQAPKKDSDFFWIY